MNKIRSLIIVSTDAEYVVRDLTPNEFALFQSVLSDADSSGYITECSKFDSVIEKCFNEWLSTKPLRRDVLREIINKNYNGDYFAEFEFIFDEVVKKFRSR